MARKATPAKRTTDSVSRAIAAIDELAASDEPIGVNELGRRLGVSASTASRLMGTLEAGGLVERAGDGGPYRLGLRLLALADHVLADLDVRQLARPQLEAIAAETGETATLSVPGGGEVVTADFVAGRSSVVSMARLGRPSTLHATAAGKVMLAFGPSGGELDDNLPMEALTDETITDRSALEKQVREVRRQGWAEACEERERDLNALAAPVFGHGGDLVAILGVQGPATRMGPARRKEVLPTLLDAAQEPTRGRRGSAPATQG
ncbi:MAG: IclR family transcriptional regulator [Solirubrobacterales bacterium]